MKRTIVFVCFISGLFTQVRAQQSDLLKSMQRQKAMADAIKKNSPPQKKPAQNGLPAGYDNSWKVSVSMTRTMESQTDLTSKGATCKQTQKSQLRLVVQASFSSNKVISMLHDDDFQMFTDVDQNLKPYMQPFKGSYTAQFNSTGSNTNCGDNDHSEFSGSSTIDPSTVYFSFDFDRKSKNGNYTIAAPQDYSANGNGKMTSCTKGQGCHTVDASEGAKAMFKLLFGTCSPFAAANYKISKDQNTMALLESSPTNGELASIGATKYGYDITYSQSKTINNPIVDNFTGTSTTTYTSTLHITITNQDPPGFEAILDPMDASAYKDFVPEGPKLDGSTDHGNMLSFRVRIFDKKNGGTDVTEGHPFTVTYTLDKVSQYKGICMNYPRQNADDKPDLRWDKLAKNESHLASSTDLTLVSNKREGKDLVAYVTAYDYAAYGILKAHVHLDDDDLDLDAHLKEKPDESFATIPVDENQNKIADKWEKDINIYGKIFNPDFDEDELPKDQRRNGDGYTLFEEYRGFKVKDNILPGGTHEVFKDGHLRMDPNYKDLFINDNDGMFQTYYSPYNPSKLCWHYIDRDEMIFNARGTDPENRWVNFNKVSEHFYANQYALIMEDKPNETGGDNTIGLTVDVADVKAAGSNGDPVPFPALVNFCASIHEFLFGTLQKTSVGFEQPVKNTVIIDVYSGRILRISKYFKSDKQQGIFTLLITGTVNHEIGHAIGITHHRSAASGAETPQTMEEGVTDCCMRYLSATELNHGFVVDRAPRYCTKNEVWYLVQQMPADQLQPGKAVPLSKTPYPSNNCFGQIDVKSDP